MIAKKVGVPDNEVQKKIIGWKQPFGKYCMKLDTRGQFPLQMLCKSTNLLLNSIS